MKTLPALILASSILVTASVLARRSEIVLPSNVTLYARPGIGDGQYCLVGARTNDDGMNEKPIAYLEKSSNAMA